MSRAEMDELGWDSCGITLVTGDAYVDHPSFGMAIIGRLLQALHFRSDVVVCTEHTNGVSVFIADGLPSTTHRDRGAIYMLKPNNLFVFDIGGGVVTFKIIHNIG